MPFIIPSGKVKFLKCFEQLKRFARNHRIISTILIIVLAGSLVWLGRVTVERYQFYQVEKDLQSVAESISKETNAALPPVERACHYSSAKFSKGIRTCSTSFTIDIDVKDVDEANSLIDHVDQVVSSNKEVAEHITKYRSEKVFQEEDINDHSEYIRSNFLLKQNGKYGCSVIYRLIKQNTLKLEVYLGCSRVSLVQYFQAKD